MFRCALCGVCDYIQAASLPITLAGHDLTAQAKTGSGKTAALVLALLARLDALRKLKAGKVKDKRVRVRLMDEWRRYAAAALDDADGTSRRGSVARHPDTSLSLSASRQRA